MTTPAQASEPPPPNLFKYTPATWRGPVCDWRKWDVRQLAAKAHVDADALARRRFDCDVDGLSERQAVTLQFELARIAEPYEPTPHDVTCISCGGAFRCACQKPHQQGECYYCHNNTS